MTGTLPGMSCGATSPPTSGDSRDTGSLVEEAGFAEEVQAVAQAWREGRIEDALNLAPAGLVDTVALAGSPEECRDTATDKYREAGIRMPIISPRASGPDAKRAGHGCHSCLCPCFNRTSPGTIPSSLRRALG